MSSPQPAKSPNVPNLETLFGAASLCECEDCLSVLSPAAYLVDLLDAILKTAVSVSGQSLNGLDVLKGWPKAGGAPGETVPRRPDVVKLLLSCENTNKRVPLTDLINEILENAIVPGTPPISTDGTEDEIGANPQYINEAVYDPSVSGKSVAGALYPWKLPFDLWTAEARQYLEQLGVPRYELMVALHKRQAGESLDDYDLRILTEDALVAESLGLTPIERDIISGLTPNDPEGAFRCWGFTDAQKGTWVDIVKALPLRSPDAVPLNGFLGRAGLEYENLLDLLPTRLLNPGGATDPNRIDFDSADCNLTTTKLTNLTGAWLGTLHRMVRLARKLDWTFLELDQTAIALDGAKLDNPFLVRISHVQQLRKRFGIPLDELLSWWSTLDTRGDREGKNSLYERVFQNKSIQRAFAGSSSQFELAQPGGDELKTPNNTAMPAEVIPAIAAAVGITAAELALLIQKEVSNAFNLKTLSRIYGIASFARALKLGIQEYLSLRSLLSDPAQPTHFDPFDASHTEQTIRFIEEVDRIRQAGFKPFELGYLLRGTGTPLGGLVPAGDRFLAVLTAIRDGLHGIDAQLPAAEDPEGETTRTLVTRYLDPTYVDDAMAIISGSSTKSASDQTKFVNTAFAFLGATTAAQLAAAIIPGPAQVSIRFTACLAILLKYDRGKQRTDLVLDTLKAAFAVDPLTKKLDAGIIEKLWTGGETGSGAVLSSADTSRPALTDFFPDGSALSDWIAGLELISAAPLPAGQDIEQQVNVLVNGGRPASQFTLLLALYRDFVLVRKVAICLDRLGALTDEVPWILKDGVRTGWVGWMDPENFRGSKPNYAAFRRLLDLFTVRKALPAGLAFGVIARIDSNVALNDVVQFISDRTRWPVEDILKVASTDVVGMETADWMDERALRRVLRAMTSVRRLGVSMAQALPWCQGPLKADDAKAIKNALKARTGEDGWLSRTKPLQDALREQRRDALVSFLVGNPGYGGLPPFQDAKALFDYFLIDTQMSSCLTIARVSQAIGTVQLLIQRCLMGFEKYPDGGAGAAVQITADAATWWEWMRNFQLWVAARTVFLYPWSYLHEELRYNKSPIFREVENQLLQGELNADSAEQAYRSYLDKLHEISRLEIVGMFQQAAADNKPAVLHVFGRTFNEPHHYYYRTRTDQPDGPEWSAWEKVSVDIPGDHLIPIVWNRRLHIFWPVFKEKGKTATSGDSTTPPLKYFEIQMAYSEYRNGKWSPKAMSVGRPLETEPKDQPDAPSDFLFKAWPDVSSGVAIQCLYWHGDDLSFVGSFGVSCGAALKSNVLDPTTTPSDPAITLLNQVLLPAPTLTKPDGSVPANQGFLAAWTGGSDTNWLSLPVKTDTDQELVLQHTPSRYSLVYPSVQGDFLFDQEFFYQDAKRTFLVTPVVSQSFPWNVAERMTPAVLLDPRAAREAIVQRPPAFRVPLDRIKI